MKIKAEYLTILLEKLIDRSGQSLDYKGLQKISAQIEGIGEDYLYKKIYCEIRKRNPEEELNLREGPLDQVVRFAGFPGVNAFLQTVKNPHSVQLMSCIGGYYCYVRRNSKRSVIYRSPARIYTSGEKVLLELNGPRLRYQGEVQIHQGCLFALLRSDEGKTFHHVYKIGTQQKPEVLQGVFSGVSTAFDPIGGRVVLLRTTETYEKLTHQEADAQTLRGSSHLEERRLSEYFEDYFNNNLSINKAVTFRLDDLGECS